MATAGDVPTRLIETDQRSVIQAALIGLLVGLIGWVIDLALQRFFVEPVFCRNADSFALCAQGGTIAWVAAIVITSVVGLFALVRVNVFRPLLVVLASVAALWGVSSWIGPLEWWQAIIWHGVLFSLAYALFTWIARTERFPVAFIVTIILVILLRVVVINA